MINWYSETETWETRKTGEYYTAHVVMQKQSHVAIEHTHEDYEQHYSNYACVAILQDCLWLHIQSVSYFLASDNLGKSHNCAFTKKTLHVRAE